MAIVMINWILPHTCILCHRKNDQQIDLCLDCENELPFITNACHACGTPLPTNTQICGQCIQQPPPYNNAFALFTYHPPITKLIYDLKFNRKLVNAKILGDLMAKYLKFENKPDYIIPVPLHHKRLRERGFNQALEIARPIAKKFNIPLNIKSCKRIKHTHAQAMLPKNERKKNIKNAFIMDPNFQTKHVVILDDVVTTGQTVLELTHALQKNGVQKIEIWCCAKAILK